MNKSRAYSKKLITVFMVIVMLVTLTNSLTPVMAQQASSDIKTTINGLLTSYVPSVTQTTTTSGDVTFTHPGIGMSKAMLDNMRDHVRAADEPWASAFVNFSRYGKSSTSPVIRVSTSNNDYMNIPGGGSGSVGHTIIKNMEQDADTSFAQMIMWYITGNETYRQNAIRIIRDWSQCQSIGSIFDEQIRVSLAVYKFSFTADLLRYSDTPTSTYMWTSSDTTNFTNFLALMESKYDRYWHFMNQHTFTLMGTMGSAIFRNDPSDYQNAIKRITTNPELGSSYDYTDPENPHNRGGSIKDQIRAVTKNVKTGETVPENIQVVEMGRDQPHSYADIGGLSTVAMTAYIQGTKVDPSSGEYSAASNSVQIFNFLNDRILYGANYLSKYNLWNNVTYIPSYSSQISTGQIYERPTTSDRGRIDPGIGIVYSYYRYIEQKSDMDTNENSKYLAQAFTKIYPEGASQDFFGDSVLFYTLSAVKAGKYYKLVNKKSGKALEIKDASTADGGLAIQYGFSGGTNQIWKIESAGSGYYYLTNANSNKVLEVKNQSTANGAAVDQWSNNGGNHQKWEINDLGNGYYKILNANGGKALDVNGGSTADGASIIQDTYSGSDNQQWMLEEIALGGITGLTATMDGSAAINLSWTAVSLAPGYNIYRSTEKKGSYTQINSSPITSASYSDTGLTPNTIYYYKVEVSGGSQSGVVSATTGGTGVPAFDVSNYELNVNHTHQSVLRIMHPDRSSQVLTSQASFTSSDPAVATVDSAGLVTGISEGTAEITATYNGQAYHATVKVIDDTNLKAWYKFDESSGASAADVSGYGNTGTVYGGAAWTTGQTGNAVDLDGTNDYIALPAGVVSDADTITVAAWVNLDTVSNWMRIFDFGYGTSTYMNLMPKNGSNGKIRFAIKNNGLSEQIIDGTSALATGGWHHVAVTLNGATGILYVDGVQVGSNSSMNIKPSDMGATTQNWIGRSQYADQYADPYLDGRVDDFRIYNRAISSSEVTSVMNGQTLATVPTAPTGVTATTADYSTINLSWSAVTGATGYHVYMSDSSAVNAVYTKVNTDVITGTTFADIGLKANTTNYYRVTAVNALGESAVSVTASAITPIGIPDANLINWYKFDQTSGAKAADSSGYGNNGTVINGAAWTAGNSGNAVELDGTNDYVALPAGVVSNASTSTVAAWINLDTVSNWTRIFDFGSGTSTYMYLSPKNGANGNIRFAIKNNGSSEQIIDGTSALAAGGWHHVAVTLDGAIGILYVDGIEVGRNSAMTLKPSDMGATTQNWIGRSQFADPYLDGRVDDFRIYNRAITAAEVTNVMNGQTLAVPTVPTGVSVTEASGVQISLGWTAASNATSYNIKRAAAAGGPYTTIATGITGSSYSDTGLTAGSTYYYVVSAVNPGHESANSTEVSAALPIAQLKFDEISGTTATDATGSGWNGTLVGGTLWATGKSGNAVDLDGTNDYVSLPTGVLSSCTTCTVAAWVNLDAASNWMRIFDFGSGTTTNMFITPKNGANGKIRFAIKNNGSSEQIIDGTSALATGGWHHVAVTLNGATGILYVDGVQVGSNTAMTLKPSDMGSTTKNWIGRSQYSDPYLNGRVDDFRIYNKALTAGEIAVLAQ